METLEGWKKTNLVERSLSAIHLVARWWVLAQPHLQAPPPPTWASPSRWVCKSCRAWSLAWPTCLLLIALAAGARPFTKAADVLGEATGFQPGKWADETKFSQGYQDSKEAVDAAWKDGSAADIAGAYLSNPAYTANQVAESLPSMVVGGMGSKALLGAGRLANKIGLETAETAMAKIGTGAGADVPLSLKRRVLGGMVSEAVLQELPQSAQEQMWQNFAEGKPIMEGVARAGTEGALAGGVMGAGANLRGGHAAAAPDKQAIDHAVQLDTDITPFFSLDQSGQVTVDLFGKSLNGEVVSLPIDEQTKEKILSYWRATGKRPSSLDEINRYGTRPVDVGTCI